MLQDGDRTAAGRLQQCHTSHWYGWGKNIDVVKQRMIRSVIHGRLPGGP
jgi:hypothetical protein